MGASEGTNPYTRPSFATKNVFDVLQDLSESIGGSPGPQLAAADGQPEPIVHDLHQSLVELLERPEILSLDQWTIYDMGVMDNGHHASHTTWAKRSNLRQGASPK